jgi:hypothetical protein
VIRVMRKRSGTWQWDPLLWVGDQLPPLQSDTVHMRLQRFVNVAACPSVLILEMSKFLLVRRWMNMYQMYNTAWKDIWVTTELVE